MNETWKAVPGYEGFYSVSSGGLVRSERRTIICRSRGVVDLPVTLMKASTGGGRYLQVCLQKGGRRRSYRVHVLVAAAFIGPRPEGLDVAHADGNPHNNTVGNLRYATRAQNNADKRRHQTSGHKLTYELASQIRAMNGSLAAVAGEFNVSVSTVSHIRSGKRWAQLETPE